MKKLIIILAVALIQACAFTDTTLSIQHSLDKTFKGPISDVDSTRFVITSLQDQRTQKERIGWKKNGYGQNTADILIDKPATEIVASGIADALTKNGHSSVEQDGDVRIEGSVDRFWFETDPNFWTVEFSGDLKCTLDFIDNSTNESIYKSDYSGAYRQKTGGGFKDTWTSVMQEALDNLIENIMFDEDLAEALEDR